MASIGTGVAAPASPPMVSELLEVGDAGPSLSDGLRGIVEKALNDEEIGQEEAYSLIQARPPDELAALCHAASRLRDKGKGRDVTFSPKVFIPLTRLCRDFCGYCTFRQDPTEADRLYMSPEEVLAVAKAGERLGCTEALFTLGERPEQRYPEAREWLNQNGYKTTLEYLHDVSALVLRETSLLPHANPGTMSHREMEHLRDVNASMGLMLENVSERLCDVGGPHELAPSKRPKVRLKTTQIAGELRVAFTTGILIGIGETREERIDSLLAIRDLHARYGHVQEIIIQNFRAKPNTPMNGHENPSIEDLLWTVAVSRLLLGPSVNIQVPPNLSFGDYPALLLAGINDWGGISPLTIDYVNPEAPWPMIAELNQSTESLGFKLKPRLPVYPEYVVEKTEFIPAKLRSKVMAMADEQGFVRGGIERYAIAAS